MNKKYALSIHVFRRDLRLHDNTALLSALESSDQVLPIFIFDPRQVNEQPYRSENSIQFMLNCLDELNKELESKGRHLYFFYGKAEEVISDLIQQQKVDAVFFNRDYTPFSQKRDQAIEKACQQSGIDMHIHADALLHEPEEVLKGDGTPYVVYSAFYRFAAKLHVRPPQKNNFNHYVDGNIKNEDRSIYAQLKKIHNPSLVVNGGRLEAKSLLKNMIEKKADRYKEDRDFPSIEGTSLLSAHNKFGTISIREVYFAFCKHYPSDHQFVRELYWRDFFTHVAFHFPHVFKTSFHAHYANIAWKNNRSTFSKWCKGETGFPIIDAGMRQLNQTGYMHNRVRMIVASFLTKDLHINWQWGEKYFAQKLTDYDPCANNGGWQWAASTGCDAQPYFRIFNPWLQQQKFDPDCIYIKRWIPELSQLHPKLIHSDNPEIEKSNAYPKPMLNHKEASALAKTLYKAQR